MKNTIIGIIIVILIIAGGIVLYVNGNIDQGSVNIGASHFKNPQGYQLQANEENNVQQADIKANDSEIRVIELEETNGSEKDAQAYIERNDKKYNITIESSELNNITVYKTIATRNKTKNNKTTTTKTIRYWFTKENITYVVQTKNTDDATVNAINEIITSTQKRIF